MNKPSVKLRLLECAHALLLLSWLPSEPGVHPGVQASVAAAGLYAPGQRAPESPRAGGRAPEHSPLEQENGDDNEDDEDDCQDGARHPQHLGLLLLLGCCHLDHDLIGVGARGIALLWPSGGTAQVVSPG